MIKVYLSPEEQKRFTTVLNKMQAATGKEMGIVMRNTCRDLARNAQKLTPITPKKAPRFRKFDGKWMPVYRNNKIVKSGYTRGLAKASWSGVLSALGVPAKGTAGAGARKHFEVHKHKDYLGYVSKYSIASLTPFIEDLDRGTFGNKGKTPARILEKAFRMTLMNTEKYLQRAGKRAVERSIGNAVTSIIRAF